MNLIIFLNLNPGTIMLNVALLVIGFLLFLSMIVITRQKTAKVVEIFGRFSSAKRAGLSFKLPWPIAVVRDTIYLNIQELSGDVGVKSSDNAFLSVPWKVQFKVIPEKIQEAYYELDEPRMQMESYIVNTLRSKATEMTMDELFQSNDSFEKAINMTLKETFEKYGYEIVNVLVDDPQPSDDLKIAFDKVLASKRDKEAAQNRAEAKRIEMVGEAKAEGESLEIKARSFKIFRSEIAEGNTDAINKFLEGDDTKTLSPRDVLEFFEGVDLRDAIRDASKNPGNVVVVPADFKQNIAIPVPNNKNN